MNILKTAVRAPNMNAYAERFFQSIKLECLDHFAILGLMHMDHQRKRGKIEEPESLPNLTEIRCRTRLGGLLKHYERKAA